LPLVIVAWGCGASSPPDVITDEPYCGDGVLDPGEECDDGNNVSGDGCTASCKKEAVVDGHVIAASWTFHSLGGQLEGCPTGFDRASVVAVPIDASGTAVGTPIVDTFPCADGAGTTQALAPSRYQAIVRIEDQHANKYATSLPADLNLDTADAVLAADIITDGGYFSVRWDLVAMVGGGTLDCAMAGADTVVLDMRAMGAPVGIDAAFPCTDRAGTTMAVAAGMYTVRLEARQGAKPLGTSADTPPAVIMGPNQVTDLGVVTIDIAGL
jgi:cysteine-rich repeat protein